MLLDPPLCHCPESTEVESIEELGLRWKKTLLSKALFMSPRVRSFERILVAFQLTMVGIGAEPVGVGGGAE